MRSWFLSGSIRRQITALAIGPVILVALIALVTQPLWPQVYESTSYAEKTAVQIETVVDQVRMSDRPGQVAAILDAASKTGLRVEPVWLTELEDSSQPSTARGDVRDRVRADLPASMHPVLRDRTRSGELSDVIVVRVDPDTALAFSPAPAGEDSFISDKQINFMLKSLIVLLPVLASSCYAGWLITAPLMRFADAAQSIGPDTGHDRPFEEDGSLEMRQLAAALNDMRSRVREMLKDRTNMLRAISHDLRTPLTRLRMRAERSTQPELSAAMLNDIRRIDEMIHETLTFLSKDVSAERPINADLPSLLRTICSDFSDLGFSVTYEGPEKSVYPCRPKALARAITNLVDNGTKFGDTVIVSLTVPPTGEVQIDVSDNGPGVPEELRRKVLDPFFKASSARTANQGGGFGLGLSIVEDIVRGHGGSMQLLESRSGGLTVRVELPSIGPETREPMPRHVLGRRQTA
ncbi:sensor histidine kinase [Aurantimonas endophytica]|uniref:histidine kinase n=1 Tax=Aurantimonas endophytica TaxID=1522175 RepID=A0A7W6MPF3_9HYPH|nr:HAMP domain-containing sensor histidine kinase [Aurantimonas endophytica]MBB4002822.1 signal transduction histidine kinase [Aurantimonas endophytica]